MTARALAAAAGAARAAALCQLPFAHVAARVAGPVLQLALGGTLHFPERTDTVGTDLVEAAPAQARGAALAMERLHASIAWRMRDALAPLRRRLARPGLLAELAVARPLRRRLGLHRAQLLLCHGGPVSQATADFLAAIGLPLTVGYGIAEAAGWSWIERAGRQIPLQETRIAPGGELELRLDGAWLPSGDIAAHDAATGTRIVGRIDALMAGRAPEPVERRLRDSPYIRMAVLGAEGVAIEIDTDAVGAWAQRNGLAYTTPRSLGGLAAVQGLIAGEAGRLLPGAPPPGPIRLLRAVPDREGGGLLPNGLPRRDAACWSGSDAVPA